MMDPFERNQVGTTGLSITRLGFGGGTLGDPVETLDESQAWDTMATAYDGGIRHFDTAPWYGLTKSEHRLGRFLGTRPRDSYTVSTKIGRIMFAPDDPAAFQDSRWLQRWKGGLPFDLRFDYTRDGVMRSYEDSLQRLGINRVDALAIHDLDSRHRLDEAGVAAGMKELDEGGGYAALLELKNAGLVKAIGAGINIAGMVPRFIENFDLDFFLIASPYTLLDQNALDEELSMCAAHGASVIIGGVFSSGILATGTVPGALYAYQPAPAEILEKTRRIEAVCARHDVPLPAAALQFPFGHPSVVSVIPGANSRPIVESNIEAMQLSIPAEFWAELKQEGLLREDAPTPAL
jgi:D-threo-aldose 1-dehydrogenase